MVGQFVERARPYAALASVQAIGSRNFDSSLYSDHTAVATGAALGVLLVSRRWGVVARRRRVRRVAIGAHYPSDVVAAGLAAGASVALLLALRALVEGVVARCLRPVPRSPARAS